MSLGIIARGAVVGGLGGCGVALVDGRSNYKSSGLILIGCVAGIAFSLIAHFFGIATAVGVGVGGLFGFRESNQRFESNRAQLMIGFSLLGAIGGYLIGQGLCAARTI